MTEHAIIINGKIGPMLNLAIEDELVRPMYNHVWHIGGTFH